MAKEKVEVGIIDSRKNDKNSIYSSCQKMGDEIIQRDSIVTINPDCSKVTTVTITYRNLNKNKVQRNTPAQSDVMHKAEKPSLRIFEKYL